MTNELQQKVSELVDGELEMQHREQLYRDLKHDEGMKQLFGRYCLISDALKKNLPDDLSHNLFNRVSQALESEPTLLVPSAHNKPEPKSIDKPAPAVATHSIWPKYGMAAAVAMIAVVGVMNMNSQTGLQPVPDLAANSPEIIKSTMTRNNPQPVLLTSTSSSLATPPLVMPDDAQWDRLPRQGIELERYLVEHSESSSENSIRRGMIPYARVVSFGANGQQQ